MRMYFLLILFSFVISSCCFVDNFYVEKKYISVESGRKTLKIEGKEYNFKLKNTGYYSTREKYASDIPSLIVFEVIVNDKKDLRFFSLIEEVDIFLNSKDTNEKIKIVQNSDKKNKKIIVGDFSDYKTLYLPNNNYEIHIKIKTPREAIHTIWK